MTIFKWIFKDYSNPTSPSLSLVKPLSVPTSPFQLQFQKKKECMYQRPALSQTFTPNNLQSNSVKVFIHGDLTGEDIKEIFSQFCKIVKSTLFALVNQSMPMLIFILCPIEAQKCYDQKSTVSVECWTQRCYCDLVRMLFTTTSKIY